MKHRLILERRDISGVVGYRLFEVEVFQTFKMHGETFGVHRLVQSFGSMEAHIVPRHFTVSHLESTFSVGDISEKTKPKAIARAKALINSVEEKKLKERIEWAKKEAKRRIKKLMKP